MNNKIIYQLEADDLERIITRVVKETIERYTSSTPAPAVTGGDLMTAAEVCELLHITPQTLHNWHRLNYLTKLKIGRRVLYRRSDVDALAAQTKNKQ